MKFTELLNQWHEVKTKKLFHYDCCPSDESVIFAEAMRKEELQKIETQMEEILSGSGNVLAINPNLVNRNTVKIEDVKDVVQEVYNWKNIISGSGFTYSNVASREPKKNVLTVEAENEIVQITNEQEHRFNDLFHCTFHFPSNSTDYIIDRNLSDRIIYSVYLKEWYLSNQQVIDMYGKTQEEILKHFKLLK